MPKHSQRAVTIVIIIVILLVVGLLGGLIARPKRQTPFFSTAPKVVSLRYLGIATNTLGDHDHVWRAFSLSNGTTRTLFYEATEIEYQTTNGWRSVGTWLSGTLTNLMMSRRTAEIPAGATEKFLVTIAPLNAPWRLRIGCFESAWIDSLNNSLMSLKATIRGLPPSNTKGWSGRRYELITEEITR